MGDAALYRWLGSGVTSPVCIEKNGITSIGFNSSFPRSFSFLNPKGAKPKCQDLRWQLLAVFVFFTSLLSIFIFSPATYLSSILVVIFFHVALVSDPPDFDLSYPDFSSVVASAFGRFLPTVFVCFVLYITCVHRTLVGLTAQLEKTVLWLGPCWIGALSNYTFANLPVQRLTPHDLRQQPGAIPALIVIVLVIIFAALHQARALKYEGRLSLYLALYALLGSGLLLLAAVPCMKLRIHHYILALLLLPGTAAQTRPSLVFQGLLLGLFINGIARWGYDSILQTSGQLRAEGSLGGLLPPVIAPVVHAENITFRWPGIPDGFSGISVLVNDVERFREYGNLTAEYAFTWTRKHPEETEYFRFGWVRSDAGSSMVGDYTSAGILDIDGSWISPKDQGRTKADVAGL